MKVKIECLVKCRNRRPTVCPEYRYWYYRSLLQKTIVSQFLVKNSLSDVKWNFHD